MESKSIHHKDQIWVYIHVDHHEMFFQCSISGTYKSLNYVKSPDWHAWRGIQAHKSGHHECLGGHTAYEHHKRISAHNRQVWMQQELQLAMEDILSTASSNFRPWHIARATRAHWRAEIWQKPVPHADMLMPGHRGWSCPKGGAVAWYADEYADDSRLCGSGCLSTFVRHD